MSASTAVAQPGLKYDKGFILSSGDDQFELKSNVRSQFRLEVTRPDAAEEYTAFFVVPRLRLQLEGFAYGKANSYKVELDTSSRGNPSLKDGYVNRDFGPVQVRAGQWKRPFTRAQMTSDFGLQLNESSIQGAFATDRVVRDLGVALHNGYDKSPDGIEYVVGVFNGLGEGSRQTITCPEPDAPGDPIDPATCAISAPSNTRDYDPVVTARVGFNHGGIKGYSEGDLEGGPVRFAVATAYKLDFNNFVKDADDEVELGHAVSLDGVLKVEGFALSGAVAFVKVGDADGDVGYFGQAGYLILPKTLELVGRFAQVPEPGVVDESQIEALGGVNYYLEGHSFKWMLDGGVIHHTAGEGATDQQFRTQIQLVF